MTYLERVRKLGIRPSWCLMQVGIEGIGDYIQLLETKDIVSFAQSALEQADRGSAALKDLVAVLDLSEGMLSDLIDPVTRLARGDGCSHAAASRAWACAILDAAHDDFEAEEPMVAVLELEYAWQSLDEVLPERLIGRGGVFESEGQARGYFRPENVRELFARSRSWVQRESAKLRT